MFGRIIGMGLRTIFSRYKPMQANKAVTAIRLYTGGGGDEDDFGGNDVGAPTGYTWARDTVGPGPARVDPLRGVHVEDPNEILPHNGPQRVLGTDATHVEEVRMERFNPNAVNANGGLVQRFTGTLPDIPVDQGWLVQRIMQENAWLHKQKVDAAIEDAAAKQLAGEAPNVPDEPVTITGKVDFGVVGLLDIVSK